MLEESRHTQLLKMTSLRNGRTNMKSIFLVTDMKRSRVLECMWVLLVPFSN